MSNPDDLFAIYSADRTPKRAPTGEALATALADNVRQAFALMGTLTAEVGQALAQARYTLRLSPTVVERGSGLRLDRTSESFRDYLRSWSHQRADGISGGMHWEAQITVTDQRRTTAEIGLGLTIEWPSGEEGAGLAFVEFWTTGQGAALPAESRAFQRALVGSIVRLEEAGAIASAKPRTP